MFFFIHLYRAVSAKKLASLYFVNKNIKYLPKGDSKVRFFRKAVKTAPNGQIDFKLSMEGSFER